MNTWWWGLYACLLVSLLGVDSMLLRRGNPMRHFKSDSESGSPRRSVRLNRHSNRAESSRQTTETRTRFHQRPRLSRLPRFQPSAHTSSTHSSMNSHVDASMDSTRNESPTPSRPSRSFPYSELDDRSNTFTEMYFGEDLDTWAEDVLQRLSETASSYHSTSRRRISLQELAEAAGLGILVDATQGLGLEVESRQLDESPISPDTQHADSTRATRDMPINPSRSSHRRRRSTYYDPFLGRRRRIESNVYDVFDEAPEGSARTRIRRRRPGF